MTRLANVVVLGAGSGEARRGFLTVAGPEGAV